MTDEQMQAEKQATAAENASELQPAGDGQLSHEELQARALAETEAAGVKSASDISTVTTGDEGQALDLSLVKGKVAEHDATIVAHGLSISDIQGDINTILDTLQRVDNFIHSLIPADEPVKLADDGTPIVPATPAERLGKIETLLRRHFGETF